MNKELVPQMIVSLAEAARLLVDVGNDGAYYSPDIQKWIKNYKKLINEKEEQ